MNITEINKLYLQNYCEQLPIDRGYIKYRYRVTSNLYAHITLLEEKFEVLFVNYISDDIYLVVDGTKAIGIPYTEYLSRQIKLYS